MKTLIALVALVLSTTAFANIPAHNIDHTTIMTKDSMIILDKRAGKFWKVETGCNLPIDNDSKVRFVTHSRIIKEGTAVTFTINKTSDKHRCSIQKVSKL